jgi:ComF family protein
MEGERFLCTKCLYDMPKTGFHLYPDNPVNRLFYGITRVEYATALFYFIKGSRFRSLIHSLKYGGRADIGKELGNLLGIELKGSCFSEIDCIIPVPLHQAKKRARGYNQSEMIAEGLGVSLIKPIIKQVLVRSVYTETQTRKTVEERRENVKEAFRLINPDPLIGKHILLVDDVVTTGSTLTACSDELLKIPGVKVSIAVLAYADI